MKSLLIAGTDTNAGKTVLTTALFAYLQKYYPSQKVGIFKPLQTGEGDKELYSKLFSLNQSDITPLHFLAPLAPPIAAEKEGKEVNLKIVWQAFTNLQQQRDLILVEALGGLGSPITYELTVADLARDWKLPTVLVVPIKLGCIAQVVANVALAQQSKVKLKGIVLNCVQPVSEQEITELAPIGLIQSLTNVPVLGIMPYLADAQDLEKLAQVAGNLKIGWALPTLF